MSEPQGRMRPLRRVAGFAGFVLLIGMICAGSAFEQARQRDDQHEADRRAALKATIETFRAGLAELAQSRATELATDMSANVGLPPGRLAPGNSPYEQAVLVEPPRRIVAAFPAGLDAIPPAVTRLIESGGTRAEFVVLGGVPAVAAVAPLRFAAATDGSVVLAITERLDARLIRAIEQTVGLKSLRLEAEPGSGRSFEALLNPDGRIVAWLSWDEDRPMTRAFLQLSPLVGLIAAGLIMFALVSVRQVRRVSHALAESETRVWRLAHEDTLTGLPNHRKMLDLVGSALAERPAEHVVTFAYIDLDGFKEINDALGHHGGDQLLAAVADRLCKLLPPGAAGGRFGGDEFATVMTTATAEEGVEAAQTVLETLSKPYWVNSRVVEVGCSIGLAQAPGDALLRDDLTQRADLALRAAKRMGRQLLVCFDPAMSAEFEDERFFKRELQRALADDGMSVHYQPIVSADGVRMVGVEALLRWTHPTRGAIPPAVFIPVAEQTGLMEELGAFVMKQALGDALRWPDLYIAVNLSPVQVRNPGIVDWVASLLGRTGIEPSRVVLEITEGVLMENPEEAKTRLEDLRRLGIRIALDDFGSGYSSLSYLQHFQFDKLKIDRGFVAPLEASNKGGVIIQAIVALGRALGVSVLVEGVETEAQRVLLRLAGVDEMQGFLFARPAPRETIDRLWSEANLHGARGRHGLRAG